MLELLQIRTAQRVLHLRRREATSGKRADLGHDDAQLGGLLGGDFLAHLVHHLVLIVPALARVDQAHVDVSQILGFGVVIPDRGEGGLDLCQLADLPGDALTHDLRGGQAGALGGAHRNVELRFVVARQKALVGGARERDARAERSDHEQHHHPAVGHHEAEHAHVEALDRLVHHVDYAFEDRLLAIVQHVLLQPARGEHGREREAHK